MAKVSKKKLKKKVLRSISAEMLARFASLKGEQNLKIFFEEFFTPTERLMLAKRLALIVMLDRGYSFTQIQRVLKVSPTTVARFWRMRKIGSFTYILGTKMSGRRLDSFADELIEVLASMSVYNTRRQWKQIKRILDR